ncbi:hypothetical protein QBC34DRAFT_83300 [Podospora aff. communis PSN243]|uniref:Rho-GAP domain-containing protein n=1 Tax=Podospora aff. communis PSN243 TaxID=3040156 RepID=A0AAV9GPA9_9PEZI|nr:hypothetical protein QBC34DRAFT_83300 [Podospora aff. communis PSN243]
MAGIHDDGAMSTVKLGVSGSGILSRTCQGVTGSYEPFLLTSDASQGQEAMMLDDTDLNLGQSYMRALLDFADDNKHESGMFAFVDDIDADSGPSDAEEERQPQTDLGSPGSGVAVRNPGFSSRISRIPYTWEPGEAGESKREPKRDRWDGSIQTQSDGPELDTANLVGVFHSITFSPPKVLELVRLPGVDSAPEAKRKLSSVSVGLGTVREDGAPMSFPAVESGVGAGATDVDSSGDGASSLSAQLQHYPPPSFTTSGRPSTSTTQSSSSMSARSSEDRQGRKKPASPPRRSVDLFRRLRSRAGPPEDFIERRSLTPHGLLSFGPQHNDSQFTEVHGNAGSIRSLQATGRPVFGVDLNESIRIAPMKIRISHRGSSTSYRTFPLSVYKCCEFIRRSATDPNLFSSPGDAFNVSHLLTVFNTPPYGEDFSFSDPPPVSNHQYTIHDAGRVILLYLQDLPKPLVSSSVVKSWIMLARQEGAIQPMCSRPLETGLDFWAEALNRLPTANRNLTKHLLTLFADTVTKRDSKGRPHILDADARNLASAVARAMFHTDESGRAKKSSRDVHATLALAFLIKKRGEYDMSMGRGQAGEAKEEAGFLPSTREILEWKGQ